MWPHAWGQQYWEEGPVEQIWSWVYTGELGTLSKEVCATLKTIIQVSYLEHLVLLTEVPLNPCSNHDIAAQILFDTFNVLALFTSVQAVLSL